jgi:hypothetical protein
MSRISHRFPKENIGFEFTPLGRWGARRDEAILTPAGRFVQRRTGLPARIANLIADLNGLGCSR